MSDKFEDRKAVIRSAISRAMFKAFEELGIDVSGMSTQIVQDPERSAINITIGPIRLSYEQFLGRPDKKKPSIIEAQADLDRSNHCVYPWHPSRIDYLSNAFIGSLMVANRIVARSPDDFAKELKEYVYAVINCFDEDV